MTNKKQQIQNIFAESKTRCVESSRFFKINKKNRYLRNSTFALFDEKLPLLGHRSFSRMFPLCWWKKIICENINNFVFVGFLKFCTFRENFFVKSFMSYVKKVLEISLRFEIFYILSKNFNFVCVNPLYY